MKVVGTVHLGRHDLLETLPVQVWNHLVVDHTSRVDHTTHWEVGRSNVLEHLFKLCLVGDIGLADIHRGTNILQFLDLVSHRP